MRYVSSILSGSSSGGGLRTMMSSCPVLDEMYVDVRIPASSRSVRVGILGDVVGWDGVGGMEG